MWQDESDDSSSHAGGSEEDVKATPVDATPVDSQQEETRDGDGSSAAEHDSDYENQEEGW